MLVYANAPDSELSDDHPDQPLNWTNYRLTVTLEFNDGRVGVVWRYGDAGQHYRFVMDGVRCELIRVVRGAEASLATADFKPPSAPLAISVEVNHSLMFVYRGDHLDLRSFPSPRSAGS